MRLVHRRTGVEVKVGDPVVSKGGREGRVTFFREPHKPASEGKITVSDCMGERYVSVWGLQWIEREDRVNTQPFPHGVLLDVECEQ